MSHPILPTTLALLLSGALASAAAAAPSCREALSRDVTGVSIDERIAFLRDGNKFCDQTVGEEDCRESFQAMIQNLEELRAKLDTACREGEHAAERARGACKGAHSCLESVRPVVEHAKQSLASVQEHLDKMSGDMKIIREFTVLKVRQWLDTMDKRPAPASAPPPPRMAPMADRMLKAAANPGTHPEELRRLILELNGKGMDPAVVSMWAAANALELEHYSKAQVRGVRSTITGLDKRAGAAEQRANRLNRPPDSKSSLTGLDNKQAPAGTTNPLPPTSAPSANGLGALPGLMGAAGQLASAASSPSSSPAARGDLLAPGSNLESAAKLPSVADLVRGRPGGDGATAPGEGSSEAGHAQEPKVSSLGRKASDFSFGSGARGKPSSARGGSAGQDRKGASGRAALMKVEGQPLGATADGVVTKGGESRALSAATGQAGGSDGFDGGGGGGMGGEGGALSENAAPSDPASLAGVELGAGQLAGLLENPPAHGSPEAGELVSSGGPTLFTRVWVAHNRSLKRGLVTGPKPKL